MYSIANIVRAELVMGGVTLMCVMTKVVGMTGYDIQ